MNESHLRMWSVLAIGGLVVTALAAACAVEDPAADASGAHEAAADDARSPQDDAAAPEVQARDAGAADGDAAFTEPTPAALGSRLALWLRADRGVVGTAEGLTRWEDQSGSGNDALPAGAGFIAPTPDGLEGHPSIHFAGTGTGYLTIADSPTLHFGTGDVTSFVVFSHSSGPSATSRIVFTKQAQVSPYAGFGVFANVGGTYGLGTHLRSPGPFVTLAGDDPEVYATRTPVLLVSRRTNTLALTATARTSSAFDSDAPTFEDAVVDLTNDAPLRIGGQGTVSQALRGDIAEIVIVRGSMTPTEHESVSAYLGAKYDLLPKL
ncbi:MAG: hypothetical protein KF894_21745 [Labilithrix sp.]|nr:hypothetical protein [Labilithrix sp.]